MAGLAVQRDLAFLMVFYPEVELRLWHLQSLTLFESLKPGYGKEFPRYLRIQMEDI
jgi:hypothetical protein